MVFVDVKPVYSDPPQRQLPAAPVTVFVAPAQATIMCVTSRGGDGVGVRGGGGRDGGGPVSRDLRM